MKAAIVVFPGSNCDHDCYHVLKHVLGWDANWVWHKEQELDQYDLVVLPGGFSYGDYLRPGAIARISPIMKEVVQFANKGGLVLGICNGFQVLLESKLLPGALIENRSQKFICKRQWVRVETNETPFTKNFVDKASLVIPIAHRQGNYYADSETLKRLEGNAQVLFRYCDKNGDVTDPSNPNGSQNNIAGILNEAKNVMGMMPHPERAADPLWPETKGRMIFESLMQAKV